MTHRRKRSPSHGKAEDFAAKYDPMQVSAHKDAVSLFERCANGGRERPYRPSNTILNGTGPRQEPEIEVAALIQRANSSCKNPLELQYLEVTLKGGSRGPHGTDGVAEGARYARDLRSEARAFFSQPCALPVRASRLRLACPREVRHKPDDASRQSSSIR